jgi:hypothetical protein
LVELRSWRERRSTVKTHQQKCRETTETFTKAIGKPSMFFESQRAYQNLWNAVNCSTGIRILYKIEFEPFIAVPSIVLEQSLNAYIA